MYSTAQVDVTPQCSQPHTRLTLLSRSCVLSCVVALPSDPTPLAETVNRRSWSHCCCRLLCPLSPQVLSKLHALVRPFMLRRMKADVEICLPRKQEILLYAPMSEEQQRINKQLLDKTLGVRREGGRGAGRSGGEKQAMWTGAWRARLSSHVEAMLMLRGAKEHAGQPRALCCSIALVATTPMITKLQGLPARGTCASFRKVA